MPNEFVTENLERARIGRPPKWREEFTEMLLDYFDRKSGEDVEYADDNGRRHVLRKASDLPTLEGFAGQIGVAHQTLYDWAHDRDEAGNVLKPAFSVAYQIAKDHQARILTENGLKSGYQPAFAIFVAKNVLKWRDKPKDEVDADGLASALARVIGAAPN